jgi:hypothetical protein
LAIPLLVPEDEAAVPPLELPEELSFTPIEGADIDICAGTAPLRKSFRVSVMELPVKPDQKMTVPAMA